MELTSAAPPCSWAKRKHRDVSRCRDRKSTLLNSSHGYISDAGFCLKKKLKRPSLPWPIRRLPSTVVPPTPCPGWPSNSFPRSTPIPPHVYVDNNDCCMRSSLLTVRT